MIPVRIIGTPMTFTIEDSMASLLPCKDAPYQPGKVVEHPSIGPLRCEGMSVSKEDVMRIQNIRCSIMDRKQKQTSPV